MGAFWQSVVIAVIAASGGAITAIVNARIEAKKKKKEQEDSTGKILSKLNEMEEKMDCIEGRLNGLENSQRIILHDRITCLAAKYCDKGEVSYSDYEILKQMHHIYHKDLGGNGFCDGIMEDVDRLPKVK